MAKDYETILKELQKEFKENDKIVEKEINSKDRETMSKEFVEFVNSNKCKIANKKAVRGGKNDK